MGFEYGCFISHVHAEHPLMTEFVEGLAGALKSELEPLIGDGGRVFIDKDRLKPGYLFDPALAQGICSSACLVMVYVPQYAEHEYCLRELRAMQLLEQRRHQDLDGRLGRHHGMVIPVVLRGDPSKLLEGMTKPPHYLDFKRFGTSTTDILRKKSYMDEIRKVAEYIEEIYTLGRDWSHDCSRFEIPPLESSLQPDVPRQAFPGHVGPTAPGEGR